MSINVVFTPLNSAHEEILSNTPQVWEPHTVYAENEQVVYQGQLYLFNANTTTGATFDIAEVSAAGSGTGASTTYEPFQGTLAHTDALPSGATVLNGYTWRFSSAGTFQAQAVEVNDVLMATTNNPASIADFIIIQGNINSSGSVALVEAWAATDGVVVNELRTMSIGGVNVTYKSLLDRTTGAALDATEMALTNWEKVSQSNFASFVNSVYYPAGILVYSNGVLYERTTAGTTPAAGDITGDAGSWTALVEPSLAKVKTHTVGEAYLAGEIVSIADPSGTGTWTMKVLNDLTAAAWDATEAAKYELISQSVISPWTASGVYVAGVLVSQDNSVWSRTATGAATATWDATEIATWTETISQVIHRPWNTLKVYAVGDIVSANGRLYKSKAAANTGNDPNGDTAETNWTLMADEGVIGMRDFLSAFGTIKTDLAIEGNSGGLTLESSAGSLSRLVGREVVTTAYTAQGTISFDLYKQDGIVSAGQVLLDVDNYDLSGTLTQHPATNDAGIWAIYADPDNADKFAVLYPQTTEATQATAEDAAPAYNPLKPAAISDWTLLAYVVARRDTTDITATNRATFFNADKFGAISPTAVVPTMTGASQDGTLAGESGAAPAPQAGENMKFLTGGSAWSINLPEFAAATHYPAKFAIQEGTSIYSRSTAGVSGATFAADVANWTLLGGAVKNRIHVTNTALAGVGLAVAGQPTVAEMQAYSTAQTYTDETLYYTGDDLPASAPTHVYTVDAAGTVTVIEDVDAVPNNYLHLDATGVGAVAAATPTLAEIQTRVTALAVTDSIAYYTGNDTDTAIPTYIYAIDASGAVMTLKEPYIANDRYHITSLIATGAGVVDNANPTVAEMQGIVTAIADIFDVTLYYTGTDTATDTPTHVYNVDGSGTVTLLYGPAASANNRVHITLTAAQAVPVVDDDNPSLSEIDGLKGANTDTILYYTGTDTATDAPTYVYHVDSAGTVTLLQSPASSSAQLYKAVYSLSADAAGIVCPFDEGKGDTAVITNTAGTIDVPVGVFKITTNAVQHNGALDCELYDLTNNTVLEVFTTRETSFSANASNMPTYIEVTSPIQIQVRDLGGDSSITWNGREASSDASVANAMPNYGCWIDIQQIPEESKPAVVATPKNRVHLGSTAVGAGDIAAPTLVEIDAAKGANTDVIAYYTGTDTATDTPTYVYYIDAGAVVTEIQSPSSSEVTITEVNLITNRDAITGMKQGDIAITKWPAAAWMYNVADTSWKMLSSSFTQQRVVTANSLTPNIDFTQGANYEVNVFGGAAAVTVDMGTPTFDSDKPIMYIRLSNGNTADATYSFPTARWFKSDATTIGDIIIPAGESYEMVFVRGKGRAASTSANNMILIADNFFTSSVVLNNRVHIQASDADITVADVNLGPTEDEIQGKTTTAGITNSIVYWTGTDNSADNIKQVFWVDNSGVVTEMQSDFGLRQDKFLFQENDATAVAVDLLNRDRFEIKADDNTTTAVPINAVSPAAALYEGRLFTVVGHNAHTSNPTVLSLDFAAGSYLGKDGNDIGSVVIPTSTRATLIFAYHPSEAKSRLVASTMEDDGSGLYQPKVQTVSNTGIAPDLSQGDRQEVVLSGDTVSAINVAAITGTANYKGEMFTVVIDNQNTTASAVTFAAGKYLQAGKDTGLGTVSIAAGRSGTFVFTRVAQDADTDVCRLVSTDAIAVPDGLVFRGAFDETNVPNPLEVLSIYVYNSDGAANGNTVLPAATGSGARIQIPFNGTTNTLTVGVQAGEALNGITDGTVTSVKRDGETIEFYDTAVGKWAGYSDLGSQTYDQPYAVIQTTHKDLDTTTLPAAARTTVDGVNRLSINLSQFTGIVPLVSSTIAMGGMTVDVADATWDRNVHLNPKDTDLSSIRVPEDGTYEMTGMIGNIVDSGSPLCNLAIGIKYADGTAEMIISGTQVSQTTIPTFTTERFLTAGSRVYCMMIDSDLDGADTELFLTHSIDVDDTHVASLLETNVDAWDIVIAKLEVRKADQRVVINANQMEVATPVPGETVFHSDGNWKANIQEWAANTEYANGVVVMESGTLWQRSVAGTSAADFATDAANWNLAGEMQAFMFIPATSLTVAVSGSPTDAEVKTYVTPFTTIRDVFLYFTGSDTATDNRTYIWYIDKLGNVLTLYEPIASDAVIEKHTQVAHGFAAGTPVRYSGGAWVAAQANSAEGAAEGIVSAVPTVDTLEITTFGIMTLTGHGLTVDEYYWLSQNTAGVLTPTQPASGFLQSLLKVRDANTLMVNTNLRMLSL